MTTETTEATLATWLVDPLQPAEAAVIARMRRLPGAMHVAVMPDVHLATDVCVGTVLATERWVYPQAVGGDIGCGLLATAFDLPADRLADPAAAGRVLAEIGRRVPALRRSRRNAAAWPEELADRLLSHGQLNAVARGEGVVQLGTLGSGNHFVELQADDQGVLWLLVHSGSRAVGQAVKAHHVALAQPAGGGVVRLDADDPTGQAYLADVGWARRYADANRRRMAKAVTDVLNDVVGANPIGGSTFAVDHNHVQREGDRWVHRKGAMPAGEGQAGMVPGSMGTATYHVVGRGCPAAVDSSAHGAGRKMSREAARRSIAAGRLRQQMSGVWFDYRMADDLREEAPAAYKDIGAVLRAQRDLVKVVRTLRPVLNYKGR